MDQVFKARADPTRRYLLDSLHQHNGQTLTELCTQFDMARQSVTQHLGVLEAANLVSTWRGLAGSGGVEFELVAVVVPGFRECCTMNSVRCG
jgi:DNA-binding transcriptional ArsR family regulator